MKIISHRCNTLESLEQTPTKYGVEVDIRSIGKELIIHHEPFEVGESFANWISAYNHGTLILNVKEEGLEERLMSIMQTKGIVDYFFLDQSFPFLIKYSAQGIHQSAVRVSEFESIETALTLKGKVDWVWVDCFTLFPLDKADARRLHEAGFKLCLVSPELQGRLAEKEIAQLRQFLLENAIIADAVCTKRPELWEETGR